MSRKKKRKAEDNRGGVESRSRGVQEEQVTREVYSKNLVWIGQ